MRAEHRWRTERPRPRLTASHARSNPAQITRAVRALHKSMRLVLGVQDAPAQCPATDGAADESAARVGSRLVRVSLEGCGGGRRGNLTLLRWLLLLQHLGLVGATGPHSGSKGEHRSPLLHAGKQTRRQAHIVQMVRSRCDRTRAPTLPEDPPAP